MRRSTGALSLLAGSPVLTGAVTTLIAAVAMFLSYNANNGLPFVPVYRVSVEVPDAARLTRNAEVRIGGARVGVIEGISPVVAGAGGADVGGMALRAARLDLKLDRSVAPLPADSIFRIRYRSTFGFKYLEIVRGAGPPAPEGFRFVGTDDAGVCKLPVDPRRFAASIPASARNGCFQPQTEFDTIGNTFDARTRRRGRDLLVGLGDGLAGRGGAINLALERSAPLMRDLRPLARTLADRGTRLRRFVLGLARAGRALEPVARDQARLATNAALAFEALAADRAALDETIAEAPPLLETGTPVLRRARPLLADVAELARRLGPGARRLTVAAPIVADALRLGEPALERAPAAAEDLRALLAELRRTIEEPVTGTSLERLRETLDTALPLAAHVVPAQTVCNYWNYFFTFLAEHLSERSTIGFTQRNVFVTSFPDPGPVSIGGVRFDLPSQVLSSPSGYAGMPMNGLAGPAPNPEDRGVFKPHDLPILHGPVNAPSGQLTPEYPDCAAGQFGYPLGELRVPGQPVWAPGIGVGDYPGSLGPTTLFFNAAGERELRDTRVGERAPTAWGLGE